MLIFAQETMAESLEDLKACFDSHWKELARNRDIIPLDPDYNNYKAREKSDALRVYTVRKEGILVGYAVYFLLFHPHYQQTKWALSDIFWVSLAIRSTLRVKIKRKILRILGKNPEEGVGNRFFAFIEECLRLDNVVVMHTTFKTAHPAPGRILKRRKHKLIEHGYAIVLTR